MFVLYVAASLFCGFYFDFPSIYGELAKIVCLGQFEIMLMLHCTAHERPATDAHWVLCCLGHFYLPQRVLAGYSLLHS